MDELDWLRLELSLQLSWSRPGVLAMSGVVPRLADKKRALGRAAALAGLAAIADGITVRPDRALDDGNIREDLRDALLEDELFRHCTLAEQQPDRTPLLLLAPVESWGEVTYAVDDGVVTWTGAVADVLLRRLAHVMAWWVPGVRDVVDHLEAPDDGGDGLAGAVTLVHRRDPFLANDRIVVSVTEGVVVLTGQVGTPEERTMAEDDAWAVWDVAEVVNLLEVAR